MCEICLKLTITTPEQRQWCLSGVFIVNFEQISNIVLVFLLLTFNKRNKLGGNKDDILFASETKLDVPSESIHSKWI